MEFIDVVREAKGLASEMGNENPEYNRALIHLVARLMDAGDVDDSETVVRLLILPEDK